ncbi:MAG: NAD-dependent epimerase/dehydratase family protein [Myxococcales bacterium]|nr:NAD-dependent epimerase/dehydratase family protein [Myxococcales bacterium]
MGRSGRRVATSGIHTFFGRFLLDYWELDPDVERIIAVDVQPPDFQSPKLKYREIDLTDPSADEEIAEILKYHEVDTFVHSALLSNPTHRSYWAHEFEVIGTMHVLNACSEAKIRRFVLPSRTMVYGAHPSNPNYLSEGHPLRGESTSRWVRDKVEAEKQVAAFAKENPECAVAVLRFAPILGSGVNNFMCRHFARQVIPVVAGYDPLMQFLHPDDALRALRLTLDGEVRGTYNIVPTGVLPLSSILALGGRIPLPIPSFVLYPMTEVLWNAAMVDVPSVFLNYFRFVWAAAGDKARDELGFVADYAVRDVVAEFYRLRPPKHGGRARSPWVTTVGVADEL